MLGLMCVGHAASAQISLERIGSYDSGLFDQSAAEIVAHDPATQCLLITNAGSNAIDVVSIRDPARPTLVRSLDLNPFGGGVNSVAVHEGLVAIAVQADVKQDPGSVVFFDAGGHYLHAITVGALPDMLAFSSDGRYLLVANEGEPNDDYTIDPRGSVSVITVPAQREELAFARSRTADFTRFDLLGVPDGVRLSHGDALPSQDLEPEYITFDKHEPYAYVACQENNAIAKVSLKTAQIVSLMPLGWKDHSESGNGLDVSDRDRVIRIERWPVHGMYQPDSIASYSAGGRTYIVTANEGDPRSYSGEPGLSEAARVQDVMLDPDVFPDHERLQRSDMLGRLNIAHQHGDLDADGDVDRLYSFGARSISIWDSSGSLVWDSGDEMEQQVARQAPEYFNSTNQSDDGADDRSDDRGPEPEGVAITSIDGRTYAFCGLERISGVMTFDITDPYQPFYVDFNIARTDDGGDIGPEGLIVIEPQQSPTDERLLVVTFEVTGTTVIYRVRSGQSD